MKPSAGFLQARGGAVIESLLDWISEHAKIEVESAENANWEWVKYSDGTAEAVTKLREEDIAWSGNSPLYYSSSRILALPSNVFTEVDMAVVTVFTNNGAVFTGLVNSVNLTQIVFTWVRIYGGNDKKTTQYKIKVFGKWK